MARLCVGSVRHRRFLPRAHGFTYPVFMALLDVDRLPEAMAASPLLGLNRFAWASYDDRDHLGDPSRPLRERLRESAEAAGHAFPEGQVLLLANLRFWGYCFNPVSYIYAHHPDGRLALIGAEVCNTPWKERIVYWMVPEGEGPAWAFTVPKAMHVSPFMPMDLAYRWTFTPPGADTLRIRMALHPQASPRELQFDADLDLEARPWTPREIRRALFAFPFHTLKVITAIHWEALFLWLKRIPVFTHPARQHG